MSATAGVAPITHLPPKLAVHSSLNDNRRTKTITQMDTYRAKLQNRGGAIVLGKYVAIGPIHFEKGHFSALEKGLDSPSAKTD